MQVLSVQNNYNNNNSYRPSFKSVIVEKSAQKVVESMTKAEQKAFNEIVERLSDTKFWDMRLSKVISGANEFWCDFVYKKNPKKVYKMGIFPMKAEGSMVEVYPMFAKSDSDFVKLRFSSQQRAQAMMDMDKRHSKEMLESNYKSTNIQRLTRWAEKLEFLDEAYRYMKSGEVFSPDGVPTGTIIKPSVWTRISNFFNLD